MIISRFTKYKPCIKSDVRNMSFVLKYLFQYSNIMKTVSNELAKT